MRNLVISSVKAQTLLDSALTAQTEPYSPAAIALDLDERILYCARGLSGSQNSSQGSNSAPQVTLVKILPGRGPLPLPTYATLLETYPSNKPFVLSLQFLQETRTLVLVLSNGEIVLFPVDETDPQWEVVGAFDEGLEAASWSPDESLLVLATSDGKLVEMTAGFDPLYEKPLRTPDFGEDAQVNINWGSKATQFHGSLGKAAAAAASQPQHPVGSSPDDDGRVRISWRGDGAYFVVSTLDDYENDEGPKARRVVRVYDRDTTLQSTVEPTAGLEHALAWRPSGNFIATSQRFFGPDSGHLGGGLGRPGRHDIVFFERNGLRRTEFDGEWIKQANTADTWSYNVKELDWSCDSNILSIWLRRGDEDVLQLWTTGNWHWYLKQEIRPSGSKRFTAIKWHPEQAHILMLATEETFFEYTLDYEIVRSLTNPPDDLGMVAVVDRGNALLTPFRIQNVPPPGASFTLKLHDLAIPPMHLGLSQTGDALAAILHEPSAGSYVAFWSLDPRKVPGRGKVVNPRKLGHHALEVAQATQVLVSNSDDGGWHVYVLAQNKQGEGVIYDYRISDDRWVEEGKYSCDGNGSLVAINGKNCPVLWQSSTGQLRYASTMLPFSCFPNLCYHSQCTTVVTGSRPTTLVFGLSASKLYVTTDSLGSAVLITSLASSFIASGSFLIYITTENDSVYTPLKELVDRLSVSEEGIDGVAASLGALSSSWEKRRVERGSKIVTTVPSAMNVVLQMPRGNLETINPRPLALEVIRSDITKFDYGKAFSACRKHRIDLSILVEQNPSQFTENVSLFLQQVSDVDDLNLFLTTLGRSPVNAELVSKICGDVRTELEKVDAVKYINTILTAYVVERPPKHEEALVHLYKLRETESQPVEDAVRYIIFLVDADKLFDVALGMYDFTLVLLIAQHSQKDPREYLPFLRELKALEKNYQRFKIDDYLKRFEKALQHLYDGGSTYFDEALRYIEEHQLYREALSMWKEQEAEHNVIMDLYGDWMLDRREFSDAALAFQMAGKPVKAMMAYEKGHFWRPLFTLALRNGLGGDKIQEMAYRVAEDLCSRKRWLDAAIVYLDYASDIVEATRALTNGNALDDALRIVAKHQSPELIDKVIRPGALDLATQMLEDLEEMEEQLRKQYSRIKELRISKAGNPNAFFGVEDLTLHNVDVTTDVSTPITTFTRYTIAPTSTSRSVSKRTSRSKRKLDMKNAAGRRGTVEEETYILTSWGKLSTRLTTLQGEVGKLLPHLLLFSEEYVEEGQKLQQAILSFEEKFQRIVDEIWVEESSNTLPSNGIEEPSDIATPQKDKPYTTKPAKPTFGAQDWMVRFWR